MVQTRSSSSSTKEATDGITGKVTRSKAAKERGEVAVPESLYEHIQEALVLWEQLEANTSDKDLQSKNRYIRNIIDISASIHIYNDNLPSDWSFHLDTARLCVPDKSPARNLISKKKRKRERKNKHPNPHITNPRFVDQLAWQEFKNRNEVDRVPTLKVLPFPVDEEIKNPLKVDDDFARLICSYAVEVFNYSYQMYVNKDNEKNISDPKILDCYYLKVEKWYLFYMTIKAIEQSRRGKYEIRARCNFYDGAITLDSFACPFPDMSAARVKLKAKMIKDGPPYNFPPGVRYEDVKDGWMDPEVYYESSGMVRRRSVLGGYDYLNPCGWDRWMA